VLLAHAAEDVGVGHERGALGRVLGREARASRLDRDAQGRAVRRRRSLAGHGRRVLLREGRDHRAPLVVGQLVRLGDPHDRGEPARERLVERERPFVAGRVHGREDEAQVRQRQPHDRPGADHLEPLRLHGRRRARELVHDHRMSRLDRERRARVADLAVGEGLRDGEAQHVLEERLGGVVDSDHVRPERLREPLHERRLRGAVGADEQDRLAEDQRAEDRQRDAADADDPERAQVCLEGALDGGVELAGARVSGSGTAWVHAGSLVHGASPMRVARWRVRRRVDDAPRRAGPAPATRGRAGRGSGRPSRRRRRRPRPARRPGPRGPHPRGGPARSRSGRSHRSRRRGVMTTRPCSTAACTAASSIRRVRSRFRACFVIGSPSVLAMNTSGSRTLIADMADGGHGRARGFARGPAPTGWVERSFTGATSAHRGLPRPWDGPRWARRVACRAAPTASMTSRSSS
jgi:hypothetical protein